MVTFKNTYLFGVTILKQIWNYQNVFNGNENLLIILKNGYVADDFLVHFLSSLQWVLIQFLAKSTNNQKQEDLNGAAKVLILGKHK